MKTCKKCGEPKPVAEFNKNASARDGLRSNCRACENIAKAKWRAINQDKTKASWAKWSSENPDKVKAKRAKWKTENPDKVKASFAKWYAKNADKINAISASRYAECPDKKRESVAKYRALNLVKARACTAKWKAANPEKARLAVIKWCSEHPEELRIIRHNRRARERAAGGRFTPGLVNRLLKLQRGKCACCGLPLGTDFHLDHIMPLALGGSNTDDNAQLLRAKCNLQKNAKHPVDFMQSRGFLL